MSILFYGQIKIIRNIGDSIIAFYAADSGVEKVLYYDRKQVPLNGTRGFCNICNVCLSNCTTGINGGPGNCIESKCQGCISTPLNVDGCNLLTCENCKISFNSFFEGKSYEIKAFVVPNGLLSITSIDSKGNYQSVSRKIQLQMLNQ